MIIMIIENLTCVRYKSRPNRFTVEFIDNNDEIQLAHLHDPGRLKELLIENVPILVEYVEDYHKTNRKTKYNMIGVYYEDYWVLLNSSFHNKLVEELISERKIKSLTDYEIYKPEYTYGNSRLDFLLKNKKDNPLYLEVKGCTLVIDSVAMFPDAPTIRGTKHLNELINIKKENKDSAVIILVLQNSAKTFMPNYNTDENFANTLKEAYNEKVTILPVHITTSYKNNNLILEYDKILPLKFPDNV